MRIARNRLAGFSAVAWAVTGVAVVPALAGGSIGLDEVLVAISKSPNLVAEIQAELGKNKLTSSDVICDGARHGSQWTYLGGGRAAPYECEIGKRTVRIEADRVYFDGRGKLLGDVENADPKRAKTFREDNFRWIWIP